MEWSSPVGDGHVITHEFFASAQGRRVPGVFWCASGASRSRRPLVLIGHGGSHHKTAAGVVATARRFICQHGFHVMAIDGPIHGARQDVLSVGPQRQLEFRGMWERDNRIDAMVADWHSAFAGVLATGQVDEARIAWFGTSMGTAYGLPFVASEPRVQAALLGMWGTCYPNSDRLAEIAPQVKCPVLFQQKWNDQLFTREGQFDLFDRLGSEHKWLKVYMGPHGPTEGGQLDDAIAFLATQLGDPN